MKKTKYVFKHFIIVNGQKKEIDPSKCEEITNQCKLFWANLATGNEHSIASKHSDISDT